MKKTALAALILVTACPAMASTHHVDRHGHYVYLHSHTGHQHADRGYHNPRRAEAHGDRHASRPVDGFGLHSPITCDMVRSYVAQVGLVQARAMALAAGMTASQERRAKQCLEKRV
jgi:hypothetical protein